MERVKEYTVDCVASLVGAWIEIFFTLYVSVCTYVASLVGAWIEI